MISLGTLFVGMAVAMLSYNFGVEAGKASLVKQDSEFDSEVVNISDDDIEILDGDEIEIEEDES